MDFPRKFGIGIIMIIPSFVGGGAIWDIFHSYIPVFIWIAIMIVVYGAILKGKLASS